MTGKLLWIKDKKKKKIHANRSGLFDHSSKAKYLILLNQVSQYNHNIQVSDKNNTFINYVIPWLQLHHF